MSQAKVGDKVKVHYTGKLTDGTVFDSSKDREPLEFKIGEGSLIKGFEEGVVNMEVGQNKKVTIDPAEGYGERQDELVAEIEKERLPENISPDVGQRLQIQQPNGQLFYATITDVGDSTITLDANHPLAGETLVFDIELVDIQ